MQTREEQRGGRQAPRRPVFLFCLFPFALLLCGCFGGTQNPSYFPYLLPSEDIIQTHAKPIGPGYYANFDPHAVRLEVRPADATNPVRTQHVLVATVYDENGKPRRDRRVEWMLEGVGHIIQVDESGVLPGRGYKVHDKYAVSYTNYCEHTITRGNANPADDFTLRPGQTWCVVSAASEGDTRVTVYAPGIFDWQKSTVVVTCRWVDAAWKFAGPVVARAGSEAVLTTGVFRHSEQQPLAGYRVRYKVLDGPEALFLPGRGQEVVAVSDIGGNATARLVQRSPLGGVNRVGIEIIRAPDPTVPSSSGIVLASGETTVEWVGPSIALTHAGPPYAGVGVEVPYTISVANNGKAEAHAMTVTNPIPEGFQYVRSTPPAVLDNGRLVWTLGRLAPGQVHTVQTVFRSTRLGAVTNCATVVTDEALKDEKCVTTQITQPGLKVFAAGPTVGVVGKPEVFRVTVSNPGGSPAGNVMLTATFDKGLEFTDPVGSVNLTLGELKPLEQRDLPPLTLTPRQAGRLALRVAAKADGGLADQAEHAIEVRQARLGVSVAGPKTQYVGLPAEWEITVKNPGEVPLAGVTLRDQLPAEVRFQGSTEGGRPGEGEVVWDLGTLQPGEQKSVRVTATCEKPAAQAVNRATASAASGVQAGGEAQVEIRGVAAFAMDVKDIGDPVELGKRVTYRVAVTNTGSVPAADVEVKAVLPPELQLVEGGAKGPSAAAVAGQVITFAKVPSVAPQQTLEYTVEAQGMKPGDVRFRVELRAPSLKEPVVREESTRVYQVPPGAGARGPEPPAVPAVSVDRIPVRLPPGPPAPPPPPAPPR